MAYLASQTDTYSKREIDMMLNNLNEQLKKSNGIHGPIVDIKSYFDGRGWGISVYYSDGYSVVVRVLDAY